MDQFNFEAFKEYAVRLVALGEYPPDVKTVYDDDDRCSVFLRDCLDYVLACVIEHNRRTRDEYLRSSD